MFGIPRAGPPPGKKVPTMRPPSMRPPFNMRARSATPATNGRISPTESVASVTTNASRVRSPTSQYGGTKRKERDYENEGEEETNINVVVRCRGRNDREVRENSGVVVFTEGIKGNSVELSMGPSALSNKTYHFDKVFSPAADQGMIFDEVVAPILDEVCKAFSCILRILTRIEGTCWFQLHYFRLWTDGNWKNIHYVWRYIGYPSSTGCCWHHPTGSVLTL